MTTPRNFIILSAERADAPDNAARTAALRTLLTHSGHPEPLDFDEVEGCYNGVTEAAFRVWAPDDFEAGIRVALVLHGLARYFGQESILLVTHNAKTGTMDAYLSYLVAHDESQLEHIGTWQPLTGAQPDSYSIINGQTYVVV